MTFETLARERYSCRRFTGQRVEDEKIHKILETASVAPTAKNAQPFHLWVVRSEEGKTKINKTTRYGFGADTFIVLGADPKYAFCRDQDKKNFADIDAAIVGAHVLFQIQELGLGTTWVGKFDPQKMKEEFPSMEGYELIALFPIGYPDTSAPAGRPTKRHFEKKRIEGLADII